ncbi:MAG: Gentisate 1,2-dioxygenase [Chloroflexi bacterium]|nr:Gentisate 1,2-dioxygenase [Chloroflexota bacterium]
MAQTITQPTERLWRSDADTPYEKFIKREGVPITKAYGITDLGEIDYAYWDRIGADAGFVMLHGMEGMTGGYVVRMPAGASTKTDQHLFESIVYILQGRGSTTLEGPDGSTVQFEWQEGSLFAIPLNAPHRFFAHGEPVRFVVFTTAPLVFDLFHSAEFVYGTPHAFRDRFDGGSEFIHRDERIEEPSENLLGSFSHRGWLTNFVADARTVLPDEISEKNRSLRFIQYEMADNTLITHESKYPSGSYMQGHYHGGGAILLILRSVGYSLMWPMTAGDQPFESGNADKVIRIDWKPGAIFSPPAGWFHQHFNAGPTDALQLAIRYGSTRYPMGVWRAQSNGEESDGRARTMIPRSQGGNVISYAAEDPHIRVMFNEAIAKNGVEAWVRK